MQGHHTQSACALYVDPLLKKTLQTVCLAMTCQKSSFFMLSREGDKLEEKWCSEGQPVGEADLQGGDNLFIRLINADVDTLCEDTNNQELPGISAEASNVMLSKVFRMDGANKSFLGIVLCMNKVNERGEAAAFTD